jgi:hypothetical protein
MPVPRILYDGWSLVRAPLSAAATHLRTLLTLAPANAELLLALPAELAEGLPSRIVHIVQAAHERSAWEQKLLPELAQRERADLIHTTAAAASLFGSVPTLVSPAEVGGAGRSRLAAAQAQGGLARATLLWPSDLPAPPHSGRLELLPPVADLPAEFGQVPASLPDEFLLCHASGDEQALLQLLESWTWAAASIGDLYPLLITGLDAPQAAWLEAKLPDFHLQDYVRALAIAPAQLPALIERCTAFIHPEPPAVWGSPLRIALAYGKAVVALQEPLTEAMLGSAAYLVAPGDLRSFGAATITVVVDEKVRQSLETQARQKAARWSADAFGSALEQVYKTVTGK